MRWGTVMRRLGLLMMVVSALALAWVAVTVIWGEPATGIQNHAQRKALERELKRDEQAVSRAQTSSSIPVFPELREGRAVGRLKGPDVDVVLTYGRAPSSINKGPGMWHSRPGSGRTVMVSGHRTTHGAPFRHIDRLRKGDVLTLRTPWGTWRYQVYRKAVVRPNAMWVTRNTGFEQMVLTACHPPYSAVYRYIVVARLSRGVER